MLHESRRDPDQRISLSAADIDALRRLLLLVEKARAADAGQDASGAGVTSDKGLVEIARLMLEVRRSRARRFNPAMFGEPAWDMMLVLYAAGADSATLTIGRLSELAGAAPTTAIRWLDYLAGEQLVTRRRNLNDARSEFVELTDKGRSAMEQYLLETLDSLP